MGAGIDRLEEEFHRLSGLDEKSREAALRALEQVEGADLAAQLRELLATAALESSPLDAPALAASGEATLVEGLRGLLRVEARDTEAMPEPDGDAGFAVLPHVPGFRLLRRLGRGGSGTVYLAEQTHPEFSRLVALKVVDRVVDADSRRRVDHERRILARLEHPGIARLYDAGLTPNGQPYLAMERVDGETIGDHCAARDLSVAERLAIFLQVLDAVDYAHRQAVVHRDLKPANIFVTGRGEAKLLDFGIAKLVAGPGEEEETRTLGRAMTPAYASPEQIVGERVTAASDIYSLGVVLYELLAEKLPYRLDGVRFETYEDAVRGQEPEPPSTAVTRSTATTGQRTRLELSRRRRALRGDLDAVVLRALRKEPAARYPSASAFAEDLRRILSGIPVSARGSDRRYRAVRLLRRHGRKLAVGALFAAIAVIAALVLVPAARHGILLPLLTPRSADELSHFEAVRAGSDAARDALSGAAMALRRWDLDAAREGFVRATLLFPGLPEEALAWDGLARTEALRGEVGATAAAARRAAEAARRGAGLGGDEGDRIAARALASEHSWESAVPALDRLFVRAPARVDLGLDLVNALLASGQTESANATLSRLAQIPALSGGATHDPRVDLAEAQIAYRLGEHQRAAAAAIRARDWARENDVPAIGWRAERLHAEAIARLDLGDEAIAEISAIEGPLATAGMKNEAALARMARARAWAHGPEHRQAAAEFAEARKELRAAGDAAGEVRALVSLAFEAARSSALEEGQRFAREASELARGIGDRWCESEALVARLALANWAEDTVAVRGIEVATLRALRESANRQALLATLQNLALSAIEQLELDAAQAQLDEATALAPRVGNRLADAGLDRAYGYLEETRGNLDLARERYASALSKARRAEIPNSIATYLGDLAWLEVAADRPDAAAERTAEAIVALQAIGKTADAQEISGVLAWADARRGDRAAALGRLAALRREAGAAEPTFTFLGIEARVAEALGDWRGAIELRRRTVRLAAEQGLAGPRLEESFGLVRALTGAGEKREARALAEPLLAEAERHGLRRISNGLRAILAATT